MYLIINKQETANNYKVLRPIEKRTNMQMPGHYFQIHTNSDCGRKYIYTALEIQLVLLLKL